MKYKRILLNLSIVGLLSALFCCDGTKGISSKEITSISEKEVNYIPYYLKVYEADSLYLVGNYERSFKILDSLFQEFEPLNQEGIYEYETYLKTSFLTNNNKIDKLVRKLIREWGYDKNRFESNNDENLSLAFDLSSIGNEGIENLLQIYNKKINWSLRDTILEIKRLDQMFRGVDLHKEDSIDKIHIKKINNIFQSYGYPNYQKIGYSKPSEIIDLDVVFAHFVNDLDSLEFEDFKEKLYLYVKRGEASPRVYAVFVDAKNIFVDKDREAYYGTFTSPKLIVDTAKINKRRSKIGLPSFTYQDFIMKNKFKL